MLEINTTNSNAAKPEENPNKNGNNIKSQPMPRPSLEFPAIEPEKNYLGIFSIIALFLVLISAVGIYIMKANKNSLLETRNTEANNFIQQLNTAPLDSLNKQIVDLQNGLTIFQTAMQGKIYYSKMFSELEKITPKNIRLTTFSMDENNTVKMGGEANDFSSVAKFIKSLQNSSDFTAVQLVSSNVSELSESGKTTFTLTSKLNTNALTVASENSSTSNSSTGTSSTTPASSTGSSSATSSPTQ